MTQPEKARALAVSLLTPHKATEAEINTAARRILELTSDSYIQGSNDAHKILKQKWI